MYIHDSSAMYPSLSGLGLGTGLRIGSALRIRVITRPYDALTLQEPGLVNFPRHVCPGDHTGPISRSSSVAQLGPVVRA